MILGLERADDAGVYRITDDIALIQTVDFFTPIVDDPYWFGQIAAANAISDIYAMGGTPLTCLNLVGFPVQKLGAEVLHGIVEGALSKITEAGAVIVGGEGGGPQGNTRGELHPVRRHQEAGEGRDL